MPVPRILGLMSGTSADGVDAVLLELPGFPALGSSGDAPSLESLGNAVPRARVLEHVYTPYPDDLRAAVLEACQLDARSEFSTSGLTQLHFWLGEFLAGAARPFAANADLISSHGQTVYHIPRVDLAMGWRTRSTLQLGEAALIVEATSKPVMSDFRPADLVAGGQAAPLVPFADRVFFAQAGVKRAVHNLGGISNLTYLPGLDANGVIAFDTGPANCLIDEAVSRLGKRFDEGGTIAAGGRIEHGLLEVWARDPYLMLPPPKSTGREVWNLQRLQGVFELEPKDIVSSVTAFSGRTVAEAYQNFVVRHGLDEIVVAGGGAYNPILMNTIRAGLDGVPVLTFEDKGWDAFGFNATTREAAAFALLGYYAYQGWSNTLPHTTGAHRAVIAGKLSRF
jgi:anhydro-N-acetylmuramic acid kinase